MRMDNGFFFFFFNVREKGAIRSKKEFEMRRGIKKRKKKEKSKIDISQEGEICLRIPINGIDNENFL